MARLPRVVLFRFPSAVTQVSEYTLKEGRHFWFGVEGEIKVLGTLELHVERCGDAVTRCYVSGDCRSLFAANVLVLHTLVRGM